MYIKLSDRKHFLEILGGKLSNAMAGSHFSPALPNISVHGDEFYLVWDNETPYVEPTFWKERQSGSNPLPQIIIVADGHIKDFLAWCSTFLPGFRPFTAYFHVMENTTAERMQTYYKEPSLYGIDAVCAGVIIGESLALANNILDPAAFSPMSSATTLSYCLARTLALGGDVGDIEAISRKWLYVRNITKQPLRTLNTELIKNMWQTISLLVPGKKHRSEKSMRLGLPHVIEEASLELLRHGRISNNIWEDLFGSKAHISDAFIQMEGPREDRVRAFHNYMSHYSPSIMENKYLGPFFCAYLADQIAPGSMTHIELLRKYTTDMPEAFLWYGFFAGLHPDTELLSEFNVLGRRIIRNILKKEALCTIPSADIAFEELDLLLNTKSNRIEFQSFSPTVLEVELQMGISMFVRRSQRGLLTEPSLRSDIPRTKEIEQFMLELESIYERAKVVQRLILKEYGLDTEQNEGSSNPPKKVSRTRRKYTPKDPMP